MIWLFCRSIKIDFYVNFFWRRFISTKMSMFFISLLEFFRVKKYSSPLSFALDSSKDVMTDSFVLSYSEMIVYICKACYNYFTRFLWLRLSTLEIVILSFCISCYCSFFCEVSLFFSGSFWVFTIALEALFEITLGLGFGFIFLSWLNKEIHCPLADTCSF